jgi:hypothetical protein
MIMSTSVCGSEIHNVFKSDNELMEFIKLKERLHGFEIGVNKETKDRSDILNPYGDLRDELFKKGKLVGVRVFCRRGPFEKAISKNSLVDYYLFRERDLEIGVPDDPAKNIVATFNSPPAVVNRYISLINSIIESFFLFDFNSLYI